MKPDAFAQLLALIQQRGTVAQLAQASGLSRRTVDRYVKAMRERRLARIEAWLPDACGRPRIALWAMGNGADAPRPAAQTAAERQRKVRQRKVRQRKQ